MLESEKQTILESLKEIKINYQKLKANQTKKENEIFLMRKKCEELKDYVKKSEKFIEVF